MAPTGPAGDSEALGFEKQDHGACSDLCLEASSPPAPDVTGSPAPSVGRDCPWRESSDPGTLLNVPLVTGIMPLFAC